MNDAIERARQIAKRVLERQYDPLLACRELADIREELSVVLPREVMNVFVAVDSEVDDLPIGPERVHWNAESLRVKDLEAAKYRAQVGSRVAEALRGLLEAIGNDSHS
jgi:hypothetical protein